MSRPELLFPLPSQPGTEPPIVTPFMNDLDLSVGKATQDQRVRVYGMPPVTGIAQLVRDPQTGQPSINPETQQPLIETIPIPYVAIVSAHAMLPTGEVRPDVGTTVVISRPTPGHYDVPVQTRDFLAKERNRVIDGNVWFDGLASAVFVTDDGVLRNNFRRPERTAQMVILDEEPTSLDLVMRVDRPNSRGIDVRPTDGHEIDYRVEALAGRIVIGSFHNSFAGVEYIVEGPSGPGVSTYVSHLQVTATGHMATELHGNYQPQDFAELEAGTQAALPYSTEPGSVLGIGSAPVVEISSHSSQRRRHG